LGNESLVANFAWREGQKKSAENKPVSAELSSVETTNQARHVYKWLCHHRSAPRAAAMNRKIRYWMVH
jgi:hypothetical protein